jgi:hypothetical protein
MSIFENPTPQNFLFLGGLHNILKLYKKIVLKKIVLTKIVTKDAEDE